MNAENKTDVKNEADSEADCRAGFEAEEES